LIENPVAAGCVAAVVVGFACPQPERMDRVSAIKKKIEIQ
jgi:hypothetical protein